MKKTMKFFWLVCTVLLACTLIFTACDGKKPTTDGDNAEEHTHAFGEWYFIKKVTCTEGGEKERICSCGEKETESVEALGHTEVIDPAVAPTCTTEGRTKGKHCSTCGEIFVKSKVVKEKGHTEVIDEAIPATCTTEGKTEGKHCSACGVVFIEQNPTPVVDHTYDDAEDEKCNICDFTREVSCKHSKTEVISAVAPTCTQNGLTEGKRCSKCGKILVSQKKVDMLRHQEVYDQGVDSTCTEEGKTTGKHCKRCGAVLVEQKPTPLKEHTYVNRECKCGAVAPLSEDLDYTLSEDGKSYIVTGLGSCTDKYIVIPSTYRGLPVTAIGDQAFMEYTNLNGVFIPDSVTSIGARAFKKCENLQNVVIGKNVKVIGFAAFEECRLPGRVDITDMESWCSIEFAYGNVDSNPLYNKLYLYLNNTRVTEVVIPDGITSINDALFAGCWTITSVVIPDSVTSIGASAFSGCKMLKNITIPDSVTSIGSAAFSECTGLTNIVIPDSVTNIGSYAFFKCSSLSRITIGKGVKRIEAHAFAESILATVIFNGTKEEWNAIEKGRFSYYIICCSDGDIFFWD